MENTKYYYYNEAKDTFEDWDSNYDSDDEDPELDVECYMDRMRVKIEENWEYLGRAKRTLRLQRNCV